MDDLKAHIEALSAWPLEDWDQQTCPVHAHSGCIRVENAPFVGLGVEILELFVNAGLTTTSGKGSP